MELSAFRFLTVKFNDVTEVCRAALMEDGVHHGAPNFVRASSVLGNNIIQY